jgi:peptidoglycan/xylan/chitin deacetylase (PgdA/CDA1 family)
VAKKRQNFRRCRLRRKTREKSGRDMPVNWCKLLPNYCRSSPMLNPLHTLGYRFLNASLDDDSDQQATSSLTRRGFMLFTATMASCHAAAPLKPEKPTPAVVKKTTANSAYRTPAVNGPIPRNPDLVLDSNFSKDSGISFSRVRVSGNYVAMTFDDGPHPQNTPRLLDMLRARNIKATFFVIGRSVELHPSVVRRTVAEGHEIGNHTHTHRLLSKLGDSEIRSELTRCHEAVANAAGVQMKVMRPPYGGLLQRQREMAHTEFGYPTILWSVDPLDWKRPGPSVVASRIHKGAAPGAIILAHDLHAPTIDAMPATLDGLLNRGYKFVTVSQLLAMKADLASTPVTAPTPTY